MATGDRGGASSAAFREACPAPIIKVYWAIEKELHWQIDGKFRENHCRMRKGNADTNFSILHRISLLLLLKNEKPAKLGVKNMLLLAGSDEDYLLKVFVGPYHLSQLPWCTRCPYVVDTRDTV